MFGHYGTHYLAQERDIIAGRYRKRKAGRRFRPLLMTTGLVLVVFLGMMALKPFG